MQLSTVDLSLIRVREMIRRDNVAGAIDLIESLLPADQADVFEELDPETQAGLLPMIDVEDAADILEELEDEDAAALAEQIDVGDLAPIVDEMAPDEAADLLGDLDPSLTSATLAHMSEASDIRPLLLHPDETAGGLMTSEYLAFPRSMRAGTAVEAMRDWQPRGQESLYLLVVDEQTRLVGIVSLLVCLRASPDERLGTLMDVDVLTAHVEDDQETTARLMARYDLVAVPVVDDAGKLVGVISVDDLVDVLEEEATEDIQRLSGAEPLGRPYMDASVRSVVGKRLGWLLLLFVTGTLTGMVMRMGQNGLGKLMAVLTVFIPLLIGTGGNAGSQTTATVIRALAVGDIDIKSASAVFGRELRTSLVLGALLAAMAFGLALVWGNGAMIGLVVASSIFAIVIWADCVGALLPLVVAKAGMDPAVVSGPLMSTLVDATGLLIYFSIASVLLGA